MTGRESDLELQDAGSEELDAAIYLASDQNRMTWLHDAGRRIAAIVPAAWAEQARGEFGPPGMLPTEPDVQQMHGCHRSGDLYVCDACGQKRPFSAEGRIWMVRHLQQCEHVPGRCRGNGECTC